MSAKHFIDTNIFIYAFDPRDKAKQKAAHDLIGKSIRQRDGIISMQVVQEFLAAMTKKFADTASPDFCRDYLNKVLMPLCEVVSNFGLYEDALSIQERTGYSYYDSLIIAGAHQGNCKILYTEDMQNGREIQGLKIINPFVK